jgi:hypothetical protein
MKIIITESQFEDAVIRYVKKSFKNEIVDVYFSGKMLEIILPGEESFKRENKIKVQLYDELKNVFSKSFPIQVHFEQKFYGDVEFDGDEESGYDVTFTKELDNGEVFEMTGKMIEIHSGRDSDYEFEPYDISNEDYYSDNWEMIEQFIKNKFYYR